MRKTFQLILTFAVIFAWCSLMAQEHSIGRVPELKSGGAEVNYSGNGQDLAGTGYGWGSIAASTLSFPIPAGTPFTLLQAYAPANFASSMVLGGDGNYYLTTIAPDLNIFDPGTGSVTFHAAITGMGAEQPNGITYDPTSGTYYIASSTSLYTVDVTTGAATLVGSFNVAGSLMIDLVVTEAGVCYAYDLVTDASYTVDLTTGNATFLGALGYDANFGQGMSIDTQTGIIYLSAFNNGTFTGQLLTLDTGTGGTVLVVDWGFEQVAPFAIDTPFGPGCPVGAPSNPTPPNGATGVSQAGVDLMWTNGAGTTACEVWFGEAGNLNMVYDGAPITTFNTGALAYATDYQWRIVDKNDTCATNGPTWGFTTEDDPSLVCIFMDDFEDTVFTAANWTFVDEGGSSCLWRWFFPPYPNTYNMPATSSGGVLSADSDECGSGTTMNTSAVIGPFDASLYLSASVEFDNDVNVIGSSDESWVEVSTDGGATWTAVWSVIGVDLTATHEVVDISAEAGQQSQFWVRFRSVQPGWDWWWTIDNVEICLWNIIPVELSSFAAVVNEGSVTLNWSTATETNNQGFEVQRSSGGEFEAVGYVPGNGTTAEVHNYSYTDRSVAVGSYSYRLKQIDLDGTVEYSEVIEVVVTAPEEYALDQNYPNPFNPSTKISFRLAVDSKVNLKVFDVLGQEVMTLINADLVAGSHEINFNASNLNSGVYFYRIEATGSDGTNFVDVKKMTLMK